MRRTKLSLNWQTCAGTPPTWCRLLDVNLDHPHFNGREGVYVIWHGGKEPRAVRVGQGVIRDRLRAHRVDPRIRRYRPFGLFVTWASVPPRYRDGVERYLGAQLQPLIGSRYPSVRPIPVSLPGE